MALSRLFLLKKFWFKGFIILDFDVMIKTRQGEKISFLGSYTKGRFQKSLKGAFKEHISPGDFKDRIFSWSEFELSKLDFVILAGKKAHRTWARLSVKQRIQKLKPLRQILQKNQKLWAEIVSRETGKALWESQGEVKALGAKWDFFAKGANDRLKAQKVPLAQTKTSGRVAFKSRGLVLVIGPFNFPLHLPFGQILPALLAGNTVIFKSSEKTPASAQKLAQAFDSLDLEPGVFQMIQGGAGVSKKLCRHKGIDAVFFTGSFETGQNIKEDLVKDFSKLLVLEMGGYNSTVVWKDADIDLAVKESLKAAFWTSGQRCTSTSQILLHKKISKEFIKKFVAEARAIKIGPWYENPFMGSLISARALKSFFALQKEVQKKGGKLLLKGRQILKEKGFYVSPGIYKMNFDKNGVFGTQESFTPQVMIYESDHLDKILQMINHSGYGLSLSVFTKDSLIKREIFYGAKVGLIHWNLSSAGASSYLPFGGLGKSGNDRPAGSWAMDFCVSPLAERTSL